MRSHNAIIPIIVVVTIPLLLVSSCVIFPTNFRYSINEFDQNLELQNQLNQTYITQNKPDKDYSIDQYFETPIMEIIDDEIFTYQRGSIIKVSINDLSRSNSVNISKAPILSNNEMYITDLGVMSGNMIRQDNIEIENYVISSEEDFNNDIFSSITFYNYNGSTRSDKLDLQSFELFGTSSTFLENDGNRYLFYEFGGSLSNGEMDHFFWFENQSYIVQGENDTEQLITTNSGLYSVHYTPEEGFGSELSYFGNQTYLPKNDIKIITDTNQEQVIFDFTDKIVLIDINNSSLTEIKTSAGQQLRDKYADLNLLSLFNSTLFMTYSTNSGYFFGVYDISTQEFNTVRSLTQLQFYIFNYGDNDVIDNKLYNLVIYSGGYTDCGNEFNKTSFPLIGLIALPVIFIFRKFQNHQ